MNDVETNVAARLHEAGETHHQVFRISDGADDDWASWYADWLVQHSELLDLLRKPLVRSELSYLLVRLDQEYAEAKPRAPWPKYYAERVVEHFS